MNYDSTHRASELATLKSLVGKRLESYRLNDTDNRSFESFVLRFPETDIELGTKEIVGTGDWFEETNTVEVQERPARNSWS